MAMVKVQKTKGPCKVSFLEVTWVTSVILHWKLGTLAIVYLLTCIYTHIVTEWEVIHMHSPTD